MTFYVDFVASITILLIYPIYCIFPRPYYIVYVFVLLDIGLLHSSYVSAEPTVKNPSLRSADSAFAASNIRSPFVSNRRRVCIGSHNAAYMYGKILISTHWECKLCAVYSHGLSHDVSADNEANSLRLPEFGGFLYSLFWDTWCTVRFPNIRFLVHVNAINSVSLAWKLVLSLTFIVVFLSCLIYLLLFVVPDRTESYLHRSLRNVFLRLWDLQQCRVRLVLPYHLDLTYSVKLNLRLLAVGIGGMGTSVRTHYTAESFCAFWKHMARVALSVAPRGRQSCDY